ncbi:hypothetical protein [Priestia aryabhattai]|uniref:hypothetical protein n=1 Tax=Priestia aryabhattai TaxID=412384 RepID=UPI003D2A70A1
MESKKLFKRILLGILAAPFLVDILLIWRSPITFGDDWQGFFGDYIGSIIGGLTAFAIVYYQMEKQKQLDEENDLQANRSYINAEEFIAPIDLIDIKHKEFSKIMVTKFYKEFKEINEGIKRNIPYYRINHSGLPDTILDCKLIFDLSEYIIEETKHKSQLVNELIVATTPIDEKVKVPYKIETHIGVFEKGIDIFIPLVKTSFEVHIEKFQMEYTTLKNERIRYIADIKNKKESHLLIKENEPPECLFEFELKASDWAYPNSKIKSS